jgi:hypothetical protein
MLIDLAQTVQADLRIELQAAQEDVRRDWLAP